MALQRAAAAMRLRRLVLLAATTHALLLDPDTSNAPIVFSLDASPKLADHAFSAIASLSSVAHASKNASSENTMGALEVSGSKRRACVVAARRTSLRSGIAAAARWQRHWLLAQFCFMQGVAARRSQTQ